MCFPFVDLQACPDILFAVAASSCLLNQENNYHDIQPLQQLNQCTHVVYPIFQKPMCALNILELYTEGNRGYVPYVHRFQWISHIACNPYGPNLDLSILDIYNIFLHLNGSFFIDKISSAGLMH